jgi:fibronectin-binding autotransporter adhesin
MKKIHRLTLFALFLIQLAASAQTTSWKGTAGTEWKNAGNWTAGIPTAATDAIIGDANFTGANQPSINANATCKSLTLATNKAPTLSVTRALTVGGNVTIGANGTISHNTTKAITVRGNWNNFGTYVANQNHATVTFSGTSQTLSGQTTFRRLTINAGSTTVLNANISVASQVNVSGTVDPGAFVISGNAKLVVRSGGTILVKAATFPGNYGLNGAKSLASGSTVDYAATAVNQTVANNLTYSTLRISGGLTKTLAGNLPALLGALASSGNIIVDAGTLDLSSFSANRATGAGTTAGGNVSVANGATLKIGGTLTFPTNYRTHSLGASSTVEYSGSNQTVSRESYGNLTLSGSGGSATKTMPTGAMIIAGNLTSSVGAGTSVSFTAGAAITVRGNVSIGASTTFTGGSFAHSAGGNWTNNGTYTGSTGTVTLSGTGAVVSGAGTNNFNNLTITAAGLTVSGSTSLTVAGNLASTGSGTFTHLSGAGAVTLSGAGKTISGTGFNFNNLTVTGTISTVSTLTVAGNLVVNGTWSATGGTITMTGAAKTLSGTGTITFNALNITGAISTARNFSMRSDLSVSGTLTGTGGTASFIGTSTFSGTANLFNVTLNGPKLQMGANAVLGIAGGFTVTSGTFDATTTMPNTVNYNSASGQTVRQVTYDNLALSVGGTKTAPGNLTVMGDLTIGSGATFGLSPNTLSLYGNWLNQGAFSAGTSTVQLLGDLDSSISGPTTFNVLTLNKTSASRVVTLGSDVVVSTLNMTTGKMLTGSRSVTITTTRTGNGIILGTITRTHAFVAGTPYAFESPNNTVNFSTLTGVSSVTMTVTKGVVADFPFGVAVNREYDVALAAGGPYDATLRLHYENDELNGNIEPGVQLLHFDPPWTLSGVTSRDAVNNWVEQTTLTDITGRWAISDNPRIVVWNGSVSSAWETAANWDVLAGSATVPPGTNEVVALGTTNFVHQPTISSAGNARSISFGSVQATTLTLGAGGSLETVGNIAGSWDTNVTHSIEVGDRSLTVGGDLQLSDGTSGHAINLNIGLGSVAVSGGLTQSGGATLAFLDAGTLTLDGDFVHNSGAFTAGAGTMIYAGTNAQSVAGGITYYNLAFDNASATATLTNSVIVARNLVLTNNGSFLAKASLVVSNDVTIRTNAILNADVSTLSVGGDWTRQGTFTAGNSSVIFNGTGPQAVGATTFNNFTVNNATATVTLTGDLILNGDLNVAEGTLDLSTHAANRGAVGGTLTLSGATTLLVGGSFPANFDTTALAATSTVQYYGTGAQSVSADNYGNLYFLNGGAVAKSLAGSSTVSGDLVIRPGATLDAGSFSLNVQGNWTNNGAFNPSTGSVTLSGASRNVSGPTTFNALSVPGSYTAVSDVTVNDNMEISGTYAAQGTALTLAGDLANDGTLTSSGVIIFTGTGAQTIAFNTGFNSTGTVNFNGTIPPTFDSLAPVTFQNVNVNNASGVVPDIDWTVNGAFVVGSGAAFLGGPETHTLKGNFSNNGTVTSVGTLLFAPTNAVTVALGGSSFSSAEVIFAGSGLITFAGGQQSFDSVIIANSHPAGVTPVGNWTLSGDLFISGATFNGGAGLTHAIDGDWSDSGAFNGTTSTVILSGAADPVNGASIGGNGSDTFNHLTITGIVVAEEDFNVAGNFANNGAFEGTGFTVSFTGPAASAISGTTTPTLFDSLAIAKNSASVTLAVNLGSLTDLTVSSGTLDTAAFTISQDSTAVPAPVLTVAGGATLQIGGANSLPVFSDYNFDPASTVEYHGPGTQTIAAVNYGNLLSTSTGARVLPSGATVGVAGVFTPGANGYTITGSTLNYNGSGGQSIAAFKYNNLVSSSSGPRVLATNGPVQITGNFTPGVNAYTTTNSTVSYNGASQTIAPFTYYHLATGGSGTKTLGGNVTVNGSLTLAAGTLADAGFTLTVNGDVANEVSHTGLGRILLSGGAAQHSLSGGGLYQNLELNDPFGALLAETNLTVNGALIFTTGNFTTTTNKVIIAPSGAVARASGHVVGLLQKFVPNGASVTNQFEIGDANGYAPVSLMFTNVTTTGNLVARATAGEHPDIANSGVFDTRDVNHFWTITNSGVAFGNYRAVFNFNAGDLDVGANPTNFVVAKKNASWTLPAISLRTATNIVAIGMTNFSDFVVGQSLVAPPTITSQPQSQTVNVGGTAQFSVGATGPAALTYQWFFGGNPIAGETNAILIISNVQTNHAGSYSVVVSDGAPTASSPANLTVNQAPTITAVSDRNVDEQSTLTVAVSATDPEGGPLTYQLGQAPQGAGIDSNGVISWVTGESDGPNNYTFTVVVSDNGVPPLTATNTFAVLVNEVNSVPELPPQIGLTIPELTTRLVTNTASDPDLPANTLTYQLISPPSWASINANGVITLSPTNEVDGPSTTNITTVVTDNGVPPRSATNSFTVVVGEANSAPVLAAIASRTNFIGTTVTFTASASDPDIPTNTLTFSLGVNPPAGAAINPNTGAFSWTVSGPSGSTNTFAIVVADDGSPSMSATQTFAIVGITAIPPTTEGIQTVGGNIEITFGGFPGETFVVQATTDLNPPIHWSAIATNVVDGTGLFKYVDTQVKDFPVRFFRAGTP